MEQMYICTLEDPTGKKVPVCELTKNELLNLARDAPEIHKKISPNIHIEIPHPSRRTRRVVDYTRKVGSQEIVLPKGAKQAEILASIQKKGYPSVGSNGKVIWSYVTHLKRSGLVEKVGEKKYALTQRGEKVLEGFQNIHFWGGYSQCQIAAYLREHHDQWISRKILAEELGLADCTVAPILRDFANRGFLDVEYGRPTRAPSILRVRWKSCWEYNSSAFAHNVDYAQNFLQEGAKS